MVGVPLVTAHGSGRPDPCEPLSPKRQNTPPPPTPALRVANMVMTKTRSSKGSIAQAVVTVTDANGKIVSGAKISGTWSGLVSANVVGQTNTKGQVTFKSVATKSIGVITFTATNITKSGYVYTPALNAMTSASVTVP